MDIAELFDVPAIAAEIEVGNEPFRVESEKVTPSTLYSAALEDNFHLATALERDPSLQASALKCLSAAKAPGTVKSYTGALKFFKAFCVLNSLAYPGFTTDVVIQYVLHLDKSSASFASFAKLKPAIVYLEQSLGKESVFTPTLDLIIKGAENRALARRGPVKKAPTVSVQVLSSVLERYYLPHLATYHLIDAVVSEPFLEWLSSIIHCVA